MKKRVFVIIGVVLIIFLTIIFSNGFKSYRVDDENIDKNEITINYMKVEFNYDVFDVKEGINNSNYIFTGKVMDYLGSYYNSNKDRYVYSKYLIKVNNVLKGELKEKVTISKDGGYNKNNLYLFKKGDIVDNMLEVNKEYLFLAYNSEGKIRLIPLNGSIPLDNVDTIKSYEEEIEKIK